MHTSFFPFSKSLDLGVLFLEEGLVIGAHASSGVHLWVMMNMRRNVCQYSLEKKGNGQMNLSDAHYSADIKVRNN